MSVNKEITMALASQRDSVVKDWQAQAKTNWGTGYKAEFGADTDASRAVRATLYALESQFESGITSGESEEDPVREVLTTLNNPISPEFDRAAGLWASLTYPWGDVQKMIRLMIDCIVAGLQRGGVSSSPARHCAQMVVRILETASLLRVRELEQELATTQEQTVLAHHLAGRFIANASHELRTPLTAVLGFSEMLMDLDFGDLNEDQLNAAVIINNSALNLEETINNLLDIMDVQAGKFLLRIKRVEMAEMLTTIYKLLCSLAERRKVGFTLDIPDDLGIVNIDKQIVQHIVYQLLASALRSTPEGGVVSLTAHRTPKFITIVTHDTALQLPPQVISSMSGSVLVKENLPVRGFDIWEVGIALVRKYVDLHQGRMEIENRDPEQGGGTSFSVILPVTLGST